MPNRGFPWVYGLQSGAYIKIGAARDIGARMKMLQLGNPLPLKVVLRRQGQHAFRLERMIHAELVERAIGREWFEVTPQEARVAANRAQVTLREWQHKQAKWEREAYLAHLNRGMDVE